MDIPEATGTNPNTVRLRHAVTVESPRPTRRSEHFASKLIFYILVLPSVSDPYSLNLDPAKNLNLDPDPKHWVLGKFNVIIATVVLSAENRWSKVA